MALESFIALVRQSFVGGVLVKVTLSKPVRKIDDIPKNIYLKPAKLKSGLVLAVTYRYATRDEVKHYDEAQIESQIRDWLTTNFREAVLMTQTEEITLKSNNKGQYALLRKKSAAKAVPGDLSHNLNKRRLIDPKALWLHRLGITTSDGRIRAEAQDKWRQINKYLEIVQTLLARTPLRPGARIVDMGSGKGYLTFALADYLAQQGNVACQILGVELRSKLVTFCNDLARECGFVHLAFVERDIADVQRERIDMLIALHACDTATDLALYAGMVSKAEIIVVAPCCHKQVRRDMVGSETTASIMEHGSLQERQAELLTDTMRGLYLESVGYKTKVFEFISVEHTPKNLMITAEKRSPKPEKQQKALKQISALKEVFGIKSHFLEELLASKIDYFSGLI